MQFNAGAFPANRFTSYMTSSTSIDVSFKHREMVSLPGCFPAFLLVFSPTEVAVAVCDLAATVIHVSFTHREMVSCISGGCDGVAMPPSAVGPAPL